VYVGSRWADITAKLDINVIPSDKFSSFLAPDSSTVDRFQEVNVVKERVAAEQ